jgi:hypothetical protein
MEEYNHTILIMLVLNFSANIDLYSFTSFALHPSWHGIKHVFHHWCRDIADGPDSV